MDSGFGAVGVGDVESRSGGRGISKSITSGEGLRLEYVESDFWFDLVGAYPALIVTHEGFKR
jgi:hypothetical protein